jgi:hypothetical protein
LRILQLNRTTLYALARRSTPEFVRHEITDAIERGEIATDSTLDSEILRRIREARQAGVMPPAPTDDEHARQLARRDHAIAAVRMLRDRLSADEFRRLNEHISRAGKEFDRVRLAQTPRYIERGFVTDGPITMDGLPLTDRHLENYVLQTATTPPRREWEDVYEEAERDNRLRDRLGPDEARLSDITEDCDGEGDGEGGGPQPGNADGNPPVQPRRQLITRPTA